MTLTTHGCPMHESIAWGVKTALLKLERVEEIKVNLVWDPPWTPVRRTDYGRERTGIFKPKSGSCRNEPVFKPRIPRLRDHEHKFLIQKVFTLGVSGGSDASNSDSCVFVLLFMMVCAARANYFEPLRFTAEAGRAQSFCARRSLCPSRLCGATGCFFWLRICRAGSIRGFNGFFQVER